MLLPIVSKSSQQLNSAGGNVVIKYLNWGAAIYRRAIYFLFVL